MTRRALCIGIDTYPRAPLRGCVSDALDWAAALSARGFEVVTLLDQKATRAGILNSLDMLLAASSPDDLAVPIYSGHGTQVPDRDGDEIDRLDEAIVPADYDRSPMIIDDELYGLFWPAHQRGVRTVFIADSCFSGTIQRLAPALQLFDAIGGGGPEDPVTIDRDDRRVRWLPPAVWLPPDTVRTLERRGRLPAGKPRTSALAFTACRDNQVASEAWLDGRYRGAFTTAALETLDVLDHDAQPTYRDWHQAIRRLLPSQDFDQEPQLDGTAAQKRWLMFEERGRR